MKKHILLIVVVSLVTVSVMGQDSIQNNTKVIEELYCGYHQYGCKYKCLAFGGRVLYGAQSRWSFGGGWEVELPIGLNANKNEILLLPIKDFNVDAKKMVVFASVAYHLPKGHIFGDGRIGFNTIKFTAYDKRCEIKDGLDTTTHWYQIKRSDGQNWCPLISVSARMSYLLPINKVGVRFMVGYDLTPRVNQNLINENAEITSSNWTEFNTYYGHPSVNLYEASEAVRKVCSMSQLYFGISIGFFSEGSPKHENPDWDDWSNH